jgi:hypothetical protein
MCQNLNPERKSWKWPRSKTPVHWQKCNLARISWVHVMSTEMYNNCRTCSYTSFSQRSEAKKMADFDVCWRHFHDNWSEVPTQLALTTRNPELQTTFSPPWFWQYFQLKKLYFLVFCIGSPKRRVECTKCFQMPIWIKLAPFLCYLSRAASTQWKALFLYIEYT